MDTLTIILIVIGVVLLALIILYNGLIRLKNQVANAWAQIDVQLKRRNDLIPNLVETVRGYIKYEKTILENITKARASIMESDSLEKKAKASNVLTDSLKSLFAVAENYPKLRANQSFLQLQEELAGTENKIAYARQSYNDRVMEFNTKMQKFPNNLVAKTLGFNPRELFQATEKEKKNIEVKF
ncbi:MAG: LemA family protein [Candidatus Nanoarchaeia archaeon]|nr:LemA family protein [Candidatus Nanoarchaeia archaeon]